METTVPAAQSLDTQTTQTPVNSMSSDVSLVNTPITDENSALNILVSFLGIAQRRGVFALDEAAKIYECIKVFQKT